MRNEYIIRLQKGTKLSTVKRLMIAHMLSQVKAGRFALYSLRDFSSKWDEVAEYCDEADPNWFDDYMAELFPFVEY